MSEISIFMYFVRHICDVLKSLCFKIFKAYILNSFVHMVAKNVVNLNFKYNRYKIYIVNALKYWVYLRIYIISVEFDLLNKIK